MKREKNGVLAKEFFIEVLSWGFRILCSAVGYSVVTRTGELALSACSKNCWCDHEELLTVAYAYC